MFTRLIVTIMIILGLLQFMKVDRINSMTEEFAKKVKIFCALSVSLVLVNLLEWMNFGLIATGICVAFFWSAYRFRKYLWALLKTIYAILGIEQVVGNFKMKVKKKIMSALGSLNSAMKCTEEDSRTKVDNEEDSSEVEGYVTEMK